MSKIDLYKGDCFHAIEVIAQDIGMPKARFKKEYLSLIDMRHKIKKSSLLATMLFGSPRIAKKKLSKNKTKRDMELRKVLMPFCEPRPICPIFSIYKKIAKKCIEDTAVEKGLIDESK